MIHVGGSYEHGQCERYCRNTTEDPYKKRVNSSVFRWMDGEKAPGGTVARLPSVHEQEDGTILAVCATGSSSRDSLLSWVRRLEVCMRKLYLQCFSSLVAHFYPPPLNSHTHTHSIYCCFHQVSNPRLEDMVVLFTLTSPLGPVIPVQETSSMSRR